MYNHHTEFDSSQTAHFDIHTAIVLLFSVLFNGAIQSDNDRNEIVCAQHITH